MILYIAEKPSLGRAIADVLPKPHKKGDGCIYVANGDCVTWCVGHLLEQAEPDAYDSTFKQWKFEHLPIVPQQWQLKPKTSTRKQLTVLRKLVKEAHQLVHAGDPDREGQLLVDQVIDYLKVKGSKRDTIQRLLINDLNANAVLKALGQLQSNKSFVPLSVSALARQRADWLYGINMTRAYTLQGRKVDYKGVLSVGRVQTPVLGLVARRDAEIDAFVSKPFYQVFAQVETKKRERFSAKWLPSDACEPYMDDEGRVLSKALAENVASRIREQDALVNSTQTRVKKQAPPLPYNLSNLQIDAAKRYGMSAKQVLDCCQSLYEKYKLITYPRSDSRYLPLEHFPQRGKVLDVIASNDAKNKGGYGELTVAVQGADQQLKSKAWNDGKVDAHHAIIPTEKRYDTSKLPISEKNVYQLVARQYIAQFYPASETSESEIRLTIAGGNFLAKAKTLLKAGWKELFKNSAKKESVNEEPMNVFLPSVAKNDLLLCKEGVVHEKQTSPPKHFDDGTLLAAMTGISRYVKDPELRKILKETDGLGTEATRAGIIELLFKRQFLARNGKKICITVEGKALVESLPECSTTPDMTASWEMQLDAISQRQASYQDFMRPLCDSLGSLILESQHHLPIGLKGHVSKVKPSYKKRKRKAAKPVK